MNKNLNKANKVWTVLTFVGFAVVVALVGFNSLKGKEGGQNDGDDKEEFSYKNCPYAQTEAVRDIDKSSLKTDKNIGIIDFDKDTVAGLEKNSVTSIDEPSFISYELAAKCLSPDDIVFGIELDGMRKVYPRKILNWHEIVNDNFMSKEETGANIPVLVTYSPIANAPAAYVREDKFRLSGRLYQSVMLMFDEKTETLWTQPTGEALVGKLTGLKLEPIQVESSTFEVYMNKYPDAQILSFDTGFSRNYDSNPYLNYLTSEELYYPVDKDDRLPVKAQVIGVHLSGKYKAYPLNLIDESGISDTFEGRLLSIFRDKEDGVVKVKTMNGVDKETDLYYVTAFWFAWAALHSDTAIYSD